jgi:cysteine synthase A
MQEDERGVKIRAALATVAGSPTIPQIFIAGRHMGGATELFDAMRDGSLFELLREQGIPYDPSQHFDPFDLMPKWLQPRKSA